jgi:hypothetical protein
MSGGTNIEAALHVSIEQCKVLAAEGAVGADIIFITDGIDNYSESHFLTMKKEKIDLWTISIDVDLSKGGGYTNQKPWLATYATKYLHVDDKNLTTQEGVNTVGELREAALNNDTRAALHDEEEGTVSDPIDFDDAAGVAPDDGDDFGSFGGFGTGSSFGSN